MKDMRTVRVGTRTSALAMAQTAAVIAAMKDKAPDICFEIVPMKTRGDRLADVPLADFGGKGAFVEEFDRDLLEGRIDIAVHSAKDVPWRLADGLELWACLKRADPRDVLLFQKGRKTDEIHIVGTASPRRELQVRELFQVRCRLLRGNVPTRIGKLRGGGYDGIILAAAGLERLGLNREPDLEYRYFSLDEMVPAGGQGIIVVEGRGDDGLRREFAAVCDENSLRELETERFILGRLQTGCHEPVGVFSRIDGERIVIRLLTERKGALRRGKIQGRVSERLSLAQRLIDEVSGYESE